MNYFALYYVQTNLLCIIIFAVMLFIQNRHNKTNTTDIRFMKHLIWATILYCLSDMAAWLSDGATFAGAGVIIYVANVFYIMMPCLFAMIWTAYVYYKLENVDFAKNRHHWAFVIPLILVALLIISTPLTKFAFTVDEHNVYTRAFGAYMGPIVCWLYWIHSELLILHTVRTEENSLKRDDLRPLLYFPLPIVVASAVQLLHYGLTITQFGFMVSVLLYFLQLQYSKISTDELTGLNNRRELRKYMDGVYNSTGTRNIFLCMIDVDHFKNLNDTYGHVEGDEALKTVAMILKRVCGMHSQRLFLARYGGDEFIIAGTNTEETEVAAIRQQVEDALQEQNEITTKQYQLEMSVGYAYGIPREFGSATNLINQADANMYEVKKARKQESQKR